MSNIRVAVRVRPLNEKEKEDGSKEIVGVKRNTISIENIKVLGIPEFGDSRSRIKEFTFDHCYDSMQAGTRYSTQAQVFDDLGTEVLKAAYDGFNACVFAYGQTGTGKTHTMMGYQNDPGLIPRICEGLFSHVGDDHTTPLITCRVDISYFEIYNERVRDLLQPEQFQQNPKFSLKVRNHPREGPYVEGLSWHRVKNNAEIQNLIDRGNEYRVTAETYIHDRSSRSHAIVTVCFTQARLEQNRPSEIVSKINLVDLAGSERADPSSKPDFRKRLTEGANINRSLVTLGYIIKALAERSLLSWDSDEMGSLQNFNSSGGGESLSSNSPSGPNKQRLPFIPYRDSVLTWLLKDSLGGNSKTIMIATITPASQFYNESISTLRYAQRAKNIVNKPRINEDGNVALIRELRREIERLQEMLADAKKPSTPTSQIGDIIYFVPNLRSFHDDEKQGGNLLSLPDSEDSIIAEKLHENEEMAKQLTESWMCKWSSTHDIMKESDLSIRGLRNQASSMGVMIDSQLPYLIGMDDDVLSTGVVIFHLKEGETYVGRDNAEKPQDIVLIGPNILTEHCIIKHQHGEVVLYPNPGSMCSVQDQECTEPTKLSQGDYVVLGGDQVFRFNNPTEAAKLREHRRSQGSLNTLSTSHLSFGGLSRASSYSSIGGDDPNCLSPYSQLGRSYPNSRRHSDIMIYASREMCLELEKKNQSEQERIDLARQELEKLREEHERAEDARQEKEEQMYAQHEQHKQDLEDQKIHLSRLIAENERVREKAEEELTHARESLAREKEAFQKELDAERRRLKELEKEGQRLESSGFQTDSPSTRSTTTSVGADYNDDDDDARHIDTDGQPTRSKVPRQMSVEDQLKELEENEFTRRMSYRETEQSLSIQEEDIEDQYLQTQEQIQAKIKQIKEIEEEYKELDKVHLQEINSQAERLKEFQKKEAQLEIYIQEKEELINVSSGVPTHLRSASSELFLAAGQTLEVPDDSEQKTSSLQNVQSGLREDSDLTPRALQRSDSSESLEEEATDMNVGKTMEDKKNPKPKTDFKISTAARDVTSRLYKPPEPKFKYVPKTREKEVKPVARTRVTRDRDVEPHSRGSPSRVLRDHSKGNSPSPQRHLGKQHSPSPARDRGPAGNKGNTQHKGANDKSDRDQQGKGGVKKDQKPPVNVKSRTLSPKTAKSPERSNDLSSVSGRLGSSGKIRQMASASNLASVPESLSEGNEDIGPEQQDPKPVIKRRNRRGRADWDDEFRTHSAPDSQSMADALDKYTAQMNTQPIPGLAAVDTVIPSFQTSVSVDESQLSANQDMENNHEQKSFEIETESGIDVNSDNKSDTNETIDTQMYSDDVVILSGNLRNYQGNAPEIVELETQTIPVDVTICSVNDDQEMDTCDKVVLGKREHTPDISDTVTDDNQDIVPAKVPKSSEKERLSRSMSCSDDSLDVSSDSLEKESGNKHSKNKQNKRLTQSLPAYFFDNQKPSSEESFNDSLEDQNNTEKRESLNKVTHDVSKFDAENAIPYNGNQQAVENNEPTGDNLDGKDVGDKDKVNVSPVKKSPNLTFSQTVCHDNIDSLEQEKLSNNEVQEKGTQSLDQGNVASSKPITLSVNSQSVNTETNDASEMESQGNDLVMKNDSEIVSNDSSKSDPKFEIAKENITPDNFSVVDSRSESVTDKSSGKADVEALKVNENNDKPLVGKSNIDTESEYSNLSHQPTEVSETNNDQKETMKGEMDTFLNSDKMSDVRKYVEQVVAGAHEQIYDSNTNDQESKVNDTTSEVIDDDQNKVIDNVTLHEPNDSDMQKLKTQVLDSNNSKQKLSETRTDHTDMDKPLEDHLDSAPRADDQDEAEGNTKPGVFTDTNNNLATEDTVQAEADMAEEAQLDEEVSHVSESMTREAGDDTPPTRTIGICTSPDLMATMEGDDDSNASLTDPDEELQVLQDALDQLPKTKPAPPGPQLSTARRAARQRAMIRQKQRAGDSDGIGHLSDESPGKGYQSTQAHRPDSGSRRRKRPSANKNSRVNTDHTSDDYDSSENDSTYSNDSVDNIRGFENQNGITNVDLHVPVRIDNLYTTEFSDIDGAGTAEGVNMSNRHLRRRHDRNSPRPSQQNVESVEIESVDGSSRSVGVQTFSRHNRGFSSSSLRTDVSDPDNSFASGEFGGMVMSPVSVWNSNDRRENDGNSSSSSGIIRTLSDFEKSLSQTQRSNASTVSQGSNLDRGTTEVWSSSTSDLRPVPAFQDDMSYVMETELMCPGASSLEYADQLPINQPLAIPSSTEDDQSIKRPDCSTPRSGRNVSISFPEQQIQQVAHIDPNTPVTFEVTIHEDNTNIQYNVEKTEYKTYALRNTQEPNREPGIIPDSIHVNITENVISKTQEKVEVVKSESVNLAKDSASNTDNADLVVEKSYKASYSSEHAMGPEDNQTKKKTCRHEEVEESKNYILPAHAREQAQGGTNHLQASGVIGATSYDASRPDQDPDSNKCVEDQLNVSDCTSDYGTITSIDGRKGLVSFSDSENDSLLAGSPPASPHLSLRDGVHSENIVPATEVLLHAPQQANTISHEGYRLYSTENIEEQPMAVTAQTQMTVPSEVRSQLYSVRHGHIDGDDYFEQAEEIHDDLRLKRGDSSEEDVFREDQNDSKDETDSGSLSTVRPNSTIASQETLTGETDGTEKPVDKSNTNNDEVTMPANTTEGDTFENDEGELNTFESQRNHKPSYSSTDDSFLSLEQSETSSNASDYTTPVQSPRDFNVEEEIPKNVEDVVIPDNVSSNLALCTTPRMENVDLFHDSNPVTTSSPKRPTNVRTVSVNTETSPGPTTPSATNTAKPAFSSSNDPDTIEAFRKELKRKIANIQHQHRSLSDSAISSDFTDGDSSSLSPRSSKHYEFDRVSLRDQQGRPIPLELPSQLIAPGPAAENAPLNDSGNVYDQEQDTDKIVDNNDQGKDNDVETKPVSVQDRQTLVPSHVVMKFPDSIVDAALAIKPFPVKRSRSLDSIATLVNTGTTQSRALRESPEQEKYDTLEKALNIDQNIPDSLSLEDGRNSLNNLNEANKENVPPGTSNVISAKSTSCTDLQDNRTREYHRSLSEGNIEDFDNSHDSSADSNESITFVFVGKDELDDRRPGDAIDVGDVENEPEFSHSENTDRNTEKTINISGRGHDSSGSVENHDSVRSRSMSHGSLNLSDDENDDSSHSASEEIEEIIRGNKVENLQNTQEQSNTESGDRSNTNESESIVDNRYRMLPNEDTSPLRHRFGIDEKILPISERSVSADNIPKQMTGYKDIQKSRSTGMLDVGVIDEPESESDIFPPAPISYDDDRTDPSFSLRTQSDGGLDQISQRTVSEIGASLSNQSSGLSTSTSNSMSSARVRSVCSVASLSSEESYEEIVISYSNGKDGSKRKRRKQGPGSTSSEGEVNVETLEDRQAHIKHVLETVEKFILPKPKLVDKGVSTEDQEGPTYKSTAMQTSLTDLSKIDEAQDETDIVRQTVLPALAAPFRAQSMDSFGLGAGIHPLQLSDDAVSWVKMSELMVETTDLLRKINARLPEMERNSSLSSTEDGQAILQQWQEISRQADRSLPNGQSAGSQNEQLPNHNSSVTAEGSNTSNEYTQVDVQYRLGFLDQSHVITSEVLSESSQIDSCEVSIQTEPDQTDDVSDLSHLNQVQEDLVTQSHDNKTQSVPSSVLKDTSSKHVESGPQNLVNEADRKNDDPQSTNKKSDGTFIAQVKTELGMQMNGGNNNTFDGNRNEEGSLQHTQEESPVIQGIIQQNTREIEELKKEHQKLMENLKKASEKRQNRKDTIISRKKVNDDHADEENALNKDMNNSNDTAMDDLLHEETSQVGPGMFINPDGCRVALPNTHEKQNEYTSNRNQKAPVKNHAVNTDNENQSKFEEGNNHEIEYEEIMEVCEIGPGMFVNSDGRGAVLPTRPTTEPHSTAQNDTSSRESPLPIASTTIDKSQDTVEEKETDRFEEIIEICEVGPGMFVNSDGSSAVLPTKPYSEEQREDVDASFGEETRTPNFGMKEYEKDHRSTSQGSSKDESTDKEEEYQEIIEIQEVGPGMFVNSDGSNAVLPESPSLKSNNEAMPKTNDRNSSQQMEEVCSKPTKIGVLEQNIALSKSSSKDESFEFEETVIYEVGPGKFFNEDLSEAVLPSHQELNADANNSSMSDAEDYDINKDPSVESKRSQKAEDTNNVNKNRGSKAIPEDGNRENIENNIPMDNNKNGVKEDQIMPVKSEEEDSVPEKIGFDEPASPESNPSFNQLIQESLVDKDDNVHIEITETGPGVFINDNHDKPQSGWIVGPGSYIPQQDGPGKMDQTGPQILKPDDSASKQSEKPSNITVNPDKTKNPDTNKPTSTESPEDKLLKEEKPKGKRHEHTWQLKDNEVIAISDVRPVSSSSSSRWRSDSEASLSSVDTATSDEVASVMEGKHRKSISNESPVEADLSSEDDVLAKHSTPVNKEHNSTQEEDEIMPVLHSKSNTSPTKLMKKLHEDGSVDKTDGDGKPVLPDTIGSKSEPRKPASMNIQHAIHDAEVVGPCKEEGHDSDNPSDVSVSTVNESFTETIETKPEMVPVLTDANNQEIVFQKTDPVLANSPEFYPSDDKKDTQASFVPIGTEENREIDTSCDTVNESFTEVVESKPESAPSFNGVLKASQGSDPMRSSTDKSCEAKPVQQQAAPRFGKSDDATQVSMEFSDDFTQTDDGALVAETGIYHQPESRKTATLLQSGVRTQKPDNSQIKSGSGKLKDDLEKLQQERLHILDLLGMSYLPTSLTVELLEAKLNYCIGQTDLLLESVEGEFTTTDTTRPYTREQQRAVDYISKYRADLKKSKQDIQECREKLNHRTSTGIGRGRTHVRKRDVYNRERQAFIDAFKLERLREQQDYERSRHGTPVRGNTPLKGNTPLMGNSPVVTPRSEASRSSSPTYIPGYMTPREHKDHLVDLRRQLIKDIAEEEYYHRSISPRHTQPLQTSPPPHHRYRSSPDTHLGYSPQVAVSLTESPDRSQPVCNTYIVAPGSHSLSAVPRSVSLDGIRPHSYHTSPSPPRHGLGPHTYHTSPSPPRHPLGHHTRHLSPPSTFDTRMTAESIYSLQESAQIYREIEEMKKRSPNMSAPLEEMLRRSSFSSSGSHRSSSSRAEVGLSPRTQSDPRLTRPRHHSPDTHRYDNPLSLNLDSLQDDTQGPYSPYSAYAREHIIPNERSTGGILRGTYQLYEDRSDTSSNHSYGSDTHSDSGHYHGLDEDTLKRLRPVRSSDIKARIGRHKR